MARNIEEYRFLRCEDGIYLARPLKDGGISKDARKIEDAEIVMLFREFLTSWCMVNRTDTLTIERAGKPFIEARLILNDVRPKG